MSDERSPTALIIDLKAALSGKPREQVAKEEADRMAAGLITFAPDNPKTKDKAVETESLMCEHMLALVEYCRANKVYFGGCGDCGSAWLECDACCNHGKGIVQKAHEVFDPYYGGRRV